MNKEEAIKFLKDQADFLYKQWSMTPEGQKYYERLLEAIEAIK